LLRFKDWSNLIDAGLSELEEIQALVRASGYGPDRIRIDPSVVRGLEYYTGPVYEVNCCSIRKTKRVARFGSVRSAAAGAMTALVSRFRGEAAAGDGLLIGVSRLQAALAMLGKIDTAPIRPVVVTGSIRDGLLTIRRWRSLRNAISAPNSISALQKHGQPAQICRQAQFALRDHQGSDEKARGEVQIKDLIDGAKRLPPLLQSGMARDAPGAVFVQGRGTRS